MRWSEWSSSFKLLVNYQMELKVGWIESEVLPEMKKDVDWMSGEIWIPENSRRERSSSERRYCQLNTGQINRMDNQFNRKKGLVNITLKSQVNERWERIERNAIQTNDGGKCSLKMSQSVLCRNWLMVVTFNWKIEGNVSGKKETTNRGGLTA